MDMICFLIFVILTLMSEFFQEILRLHLVKTYGLRKLKQLLENSNSLPLFVQQLMLTLACSDFEEIKPTSKLSKTKKNVSFW